MCVCVLSRTGGGNFDRCVIEDPNARAMFRLRRIADFSLVERKAKLVFSLNELPCFCRLPIITTSFVNGNIRHALGAKSGVTVTARASDVKEKEE